MSIYTEKKFKDIPVGKSFISHGINFTKVEAQKAIRIFPGATPKEFTADEIIFLANEDI